MLWLGLLSGLPIGSNAMVGEMQIRSAPASSPTTGAIGAPVLLELSPPPSPGRVRKIQAAARKERERMAVRALSQHFAQAGGAPADSADSHVLSGLSVRNSADTVTDAPGPDAFRGSTGSVTGSASRNHGGASTPTVLPATPRNVTTLDDSRERTRGSRITHRTAVSTHARTLQEAVEAKNMDNFVKPALLSAFTTRTEAPMPLSAGPQVGAQEARPQPQDGRAFLGAGHAVRLAHAVRADGALDAEVSSTRGVIRVAVLTGL